MKLEKMPKKRKARAGGCAHQDCKTQVPQANLTIARAPGGVARLQGMSERLWPRGISQTCARTLGTVHI